MRTLEVEVDEIRAAATEILIDGCGLSVDMLKRNCSIFHISKNIYSAVSGVIGTGDPVCACKTNATFLAPPLCDIYPEPPVTPPVGPLDSHARAAVCEEEDGNPVSPD